MSIKSFGNPNARYKATMSRTGDLRLGFMSCNPNQTGSWYGDTAVYGGGYLTGNIQEMDFFNLDFTSNAGDFGDMVQAARARAAGSNGSRGLFMGNRQGSVDTAVEYITFSSFANGTDFGDLISPLNGGYASGASDGTRAFAIGGNCCSAGEDNIQYFTIASTGNGTSFGNMTGSRFGHGSANNATRAVIGGTNSSSGASKNNIEYITMGTSGSGSNFGNLTMDRGYTGAGAVGDRAIWAGNGGGTVGNAVTGIDYVTITSTGNASDFGDMTVVRDQVGADFPGNATRVAIAGGNTPAGYISTIDYVVVGTTGNASDFGNLTGAKSFCSAASGC